MTKLDYLDSINQFGLLPRSGDNSRLIQDDQVKVFFSEGYEGAIALYVDFSIVYRKAKEKEITLDDDLKGKILLSKDLEDYLGDGVYLSFDMNGIKNERNFQNGCTSQPIASNIINVLLLEDITNGNIIYSRFDIIHYMMSTISPEQITYYGEKYPDSPPFDAATKRIQDKVKKYYEENKEIIDVYRSGSYKLKELSLNEFLNYSKNKHR